MSYTNNEKGGVLVFMTLMIVLLLVMVGMGLDTGYLTYTRSQGQAAVDAAALAAVSGLPSGVPGDVTSRVGLFNVQNNYTGSVANSNTIGASNITYVQYNDTTGAITTLGSITGANGVRVALEKTNPYTATAADTQMKTPAFLTPLMKLFGASASGANNVNVSAVAALRAVPGIPIAIMENMCTPGGAVGPLVDLLTANANTDNSCWTTYLDQPVNAPKVKALFDSSKTCSGLPGNLDLVTIGTDIFLQNGVAATVYANAEDLFENDQPGKCWFVPVIPNSTKCNQTDPILDWAKLCPTEVTKHGGHSTITATIQCQQSLFQAKDNLCFSPRLVREPGKGY
jgi:Flp pilus assembly protein TadG